MNWKQYFDLAEKRKKYFKIFLIIFLILGFFSFIKVFKDDFSICGQLNFSKDDSFNQSNTSLNPSFNYSNDSIENHSPEIILVNNSGINYSNEVINYSNSSEKDLNLKNKTLINNTKINQKNKTNQINQTNQIDVSNVNNLNLENLSFFKRIKLKTKYKIKNKIQNFNLTRSLKNIKDDSWFKCNSIKKFNTLNKKQKFKLIKFRFKFTPLFIIKDIIFALIISYVIYFVLLHKIKKQEDGEAEETDDDKKSEKKK